MKNIPPIQKYSVIAVLFVSLVFIFLQLKDRIATTPVNLEVAIPKNEVYDRDIEILTREIIECNELESVFGTGCVDIEHYQVAFDDQAFVWPGFYGGRYSITYKQPLKRLPSGRLVRKVEETEQSGVIVEIENIFRDTEGRTRINYGETRSFTTKDLNSYRGRPVEFLTHLGFRFEEGNIKLQEFNLEASGL